MYIITAKYIIYFTIIPRVRIGYKLAITTSYTTSVSGIIVLLKTHKELQYLNSPAIFVDTYRLPNLWSMVSELTHHCLLTNQNSGIAIYHC